MSDYDPKKDIGAAIRLVDGMLDKVTTVVQHLDSQTNMLIGISSAVFALSIGQLLRASANEKALVVLAVFSGLATVIGLYAIHPPKTLRKKGQQESLFYQKNISNFENAKKFYDAVDPMIGNIPMITEEYTREIYNMAKYYYRPKRMLFKAARNVFLAGVLFSLVAFTLS